MDEVAARLKGLRVDVVKGVIDPITVAALVSSPGDGTARAYFSSRDGKCHVVELAVQGGQTKIVDRWESEHVQCIYRQNHLSPVHVY